MPEVHERFWSKVHATEGCWIWTAAIGSSGYGRFNRGVGHSIAQAHRFSYEEAYGPIPTGLTLDHLCRRRDCVNPHHLEAVTRGENVLRGVGYSGRNLRKMRCHNGHEYTPENTIRTASGKHRRCRTCTNEGQMRRWHERQRRAKDLDSPR